MRLGLGLAALTVAAAAFAVVLVLSGGTPRHRARPSLLVSRHVVVPQSRRSRAPSLLSRLEALGNARTRELARLGLPIYCGGRRGNEVAFTFDDGPGPYTYLALRKLRAAGERATFFVVGRSIDLHPGWLPREVALGAIGDHTFHHLDLQLLTNSEITSEIASTRGMIEAQTRQRVLLFRPPYGAQDSRVNKVVHQLGLLEVLWSMDSRDSLGANWRGIIANVGAGLHPGAIILMHENHGQTIRALTTLLPLLHKRHLRSVSLPELLATDPPSISQVRRGLYACDPIRPPVLSGG
jgi:peptidoglycan-N-acetylglucosamine deacetylase